MAKAEKVIQYFAGIHGSIRGSQARIMKDLGAAQGTVADWTTGRKKPGPDYLKKFHEVYGTPVEVLLSVFDIKGAKSGVAIASSEVAAPMLGFLINDGKIKFSDKKRVPSKENQLMSRYIIEIDEDTDTPSDLKGINKVEIHVVDSIGKNEGKYFVVEYKSKHLLRCCSSQKNKILLTWGKEKITALASEVKIIGVVTDIIKTTGAIVE